MFWGCPLAKGTKFFCLAFCSQKALLVFHRTRCLTHIEQVGQTRVKFMSPTDGKKRFTGRVKTCPVTIGFNLDGKARPVYCGQWTCPDCCKRLARKWSKRVRDHIMLLDRQHQLSTGEPMPEFWFITLTLGRKYKTTVGGFQAIPKLWQRLHKAMRRKDPSWQYVAFVEGQPKRWFMPHFHIISSQPLPVPRNKHGVMTQHATHDYAVKMGWGFEVEQEQVSGPKNAAYISKYASKDSPKTPKGFRRVRPSRGWTKLEKDPTKRLIVKGSGEGVADYLQRVSETTGLTVTQAYVAFYSVWDKHSDKLGQPPRKW